MEDRITELCTIDGVTYVSVPDGITLPEQPEQITVEEVALTDELKAAIRVASPHVQLIDERVVMKIREKYLSMTKLNLFGWVRQMISRPITTTLKRVVHGVRRPKRGWAYE